jgi:hypothetical protein
MVISLFLAAYLFTAPSGWKELDQKAYSKRTEIAFAGPKKKNGFSPTISLQIDPCTNPTAYLETSKKCIEKDRNKKCNFLGKISTPIGDADLLHTEIKGHPCGDITLLQLLAYQNQKMVVVTASTLTETLTELYQDIIHSFQSIKETP